MKREYSNVKEKREIKKFVEKRKIIISDEKISEFEELAKREYPMPKKPCPVTEGEVNHFRQRRIKQLIDEFNKSMK